jgi:hypothetical protein
MPDESLRLVTRCDVFYKVTDESIAILLCYCGYECEAIVFGAFRMQLTIRRESVRAKIAEMDERLRKCGVFGIVEKESFRPQKNKRKPRPTHEIIGNAPDWSVKMIAD